MWQVVSKPDVQCTVPVVQEDVCTMSMRGGTHTHVCSHSCIITGVCEGDCNILAVHASNTVNSELHVHVCVCHGQPRNIYASASRQSPHSPL